MPRHVGGQEFAGGRLHFLRTTSRRDNEDKDVMDDRSVARLQFGGLDPHVILKLGINLKILILHGAFSRDVKWLVAHVDDHIRLVRQLPAFGVCWLFGEQASVTFGTACVDPLSKL